MLLLEHLFHRHISTADGKQGLTVLLVHMLLESVAADGGEDGDLARINLIEGDDDISDLRHTWIVAEVELVVNHMHVCGGIFVVEFRSLSRGLWSSGSSTVGLEAVGLYRNALHGSGINHHVLVIDGEFVLLAESLDAVVPLFQLLVGGLRISGRVTTDALDDGLRKGVGTEGHILSINRLHFGGEHGFVENASILGVLETI